MGRSIGRPPLYALLVGRAVCGALEASAHNVVIKLPRDHFDLRLNKGGSGSSHREEGREKRSQFVPPFFPPLPSLSPFLILHRPIVDRECSVGHAFKRRPAAAERGGGGGHTLHTAARYLVCSKQLRELPLPPSAPPKR